jgi:hypothetical protein
MLRFVESGRRQQWDTFTNQDEYKTQFNVNVGISIITENMLDVMLGYKRWQGFRYLDTDGAYRIGYGIGDPDDPQGYTETQAFAEWIGDVRNKQKIVRKQLPITMMPSSVFDALVSLYVDTGKWRTVRAEEGIYDLASAVEESNWLLAADILTRGIDNPELRRAEARALYLADYTIRVDRNQQIVRGLQFMRKQYVNGIPNDFEKKQAEFAYYRQLGAFLPGMSQLRQRRIIAQALT